MSFKLPTNVQDFLANYNGPYPLSQLRRARDTLIYGFNAYNSETFSRLQRIMHSQETNADYSEDDYSSYDSETEPVINTNQKLGVNFGSRAQNNHHVKDNSEIPLKGGLSNLKDGLSNQKCGLSNLKDGLSNIKDGLSNQEGGLSNLKDGLSNQKCGLSNLKDGLSNLKDGLSNLKDGLSNIKDGLSNQEGGLSNLKGELSNQKGKLSNLEAQQSTDNEKIFYSTSGFKNRFAHHLLVKGKDNVSNKKILFAPEPNVNPLQVKKKPSENNNIDDSNSAGLKRGPAKNGDVDENKDSVSKKAKVMDTSQSDTETYTVNGYKCDYCDFTSLDITETSSHLNSLLHQFASKFRGEVKNDQFVPRYVVEEICLESEQKRVKKVASCPKCFVAFSNIYLCASHSGNCSGASEPHLDGHYSLSDVVDDMDILIPLKSVCQVCKLKCSKHRVLNLHYEACNHYPYEKPTSKDILVLFICPYCGDDFSNFFKAKAHVIDHALKQPRQKMALRLIYYEKTRSGSQRLLPQYPSPEVTAVVNTKSVNKRKKLKAASKRKKQKTPDSS